MGIRITLLLNLVPRSPRNLGPILIDVSNVLL